MFIKKGTNSKEDELVLCSKHYFYEYFADKFYVLNKARSKKLALKNNVVRELL